MITNEEMGKYLNSLKPHTVSSERHTQKWHVPYVITNTINDKYLASCDEYNGDDTERIIHPEKKANIKVVDQFRFNSKWISHKSSADNPRENFGIIQVDNLPYKSFSNRINKKSFIGRIDRLILQGYIEPLMVFIDHKVVKWDDINIVYDCDESWILLKGDRYTYDNIYDKEINIIIMPFRCDYIGKESDESFNLNYEVLNDYLQKTAENRNGELYISIPTLETEWEYNHMVYNVGGWMYAQIKKFNLGILSEERINKLRYLTIYKYTYNEFGVLSNTKYTRFNALDKDSYKSKAIYESMCYMPMESYYNYPCIRFDDLGNLNTASGEYTWYIVDENTIVKSFESSEDIIYCDMSSIDNVMFRENYLIFVNNFFQADAEIVTSINNITLCDNPKLNKYNVFCIYNKQSAHVIRNSDAFLKSYMNEKAKTYLEALFYSKYEPFTGLDAHVLRSTRILKNIDAYILDAEMAYVPRLTDYIVYLNDQNDDAVEIIKRSVEPLDFEFSNKKVYEENVSDAIDAIVDYNPMLLNGLYHTYIDSRTFTGSQANESLIYQFMYENKRGLKIPRKRYRDHETYVMVFLNGELYENYYRMIAYANFFFIPVDEGFTFENSDRVEVLYFKNVNNNEIRFAFTESVYKRLRQHPVEVAFYNIDVFKKFITQEELNIFSHYPKDMLKYPTLITEPSEEIAFNISYKDENNITYIKNTSFISIIANFVNISGIDIDNEGIYDEFSAIDVDSGETIILTSNDIIVNDIITADTYPTNYNMSDMNTTFVATSKHKFIYQRLYVDQKSYRIKLHKRFRYCDNQRQYVLFINGRRMKQDSYLVTIPKHTRPFNDLFLYTARFVNPTDRIEIFYVPYEMTDLNIDNNPRRELNENGYIDYDRKDINIPFSKDLYLFFVNGKKIPYDDIVDIDTHTIRIKVNTNTMKYPAITAISMDEIPQVKEYLHDEYRLSKYDSLVNYIKTRMVDGYNELDKAFGYFTKMTDGEEDKIWADVAHIAILNEIVRDWWVTSGYPYQDQLFVYDYEEDELYEQMDDGTLILPALDANPKINIEKNEVSLLYFYTDPKDLLFEIGSECHSFKLFWEYSQRLNQDLMVLSQKINGRDIPVDNREYEWVEDIFESRNIRFEANTGQQYLIKNTTLDFVNGIYWGLIDEDQLQYYNLKKNIVNLDDVIALIPKDGRPIPKSDIQNIESGNYELKSTIIEENYVIRGISYDEETLVKVDIFDNIPAGIVNLELDGINAILDDGRVFENIIAQIIYNKYIGGNNIYGNEESTIVGNDAVFHDIFGQLIYDNAVSRTNIANIYNDGVVAVLDDGTKWENLFYQMLDRPNDNPELYNDNNLDLWKTTNYETVKKNEMNIIREYYDVSDLHQMIPHLDKHLLRNADITLEDYIIGNNKYFVFTCPKRLVYNKSKEYTAEFYFPELDSEEILNNCRDDKTTPIYTNGHFDSDTKLLHKLYKMQMEYMGEFPYTNDYGFTETYLMWKTNGFFTRLFENYGMNIHIKIGDFSEVDYGFDSNKTTNVITYDDADTLFSTNRRSRSIDSMNITAFEGDEDMNESTTTSVNNTQQTSNNDSNNDNETLRDKDGTKVEIFGSAKLSDAKVRELLDNGIFLL